MTVTSTIASGAVPIIASEAKQSPEVGAGVEPEDEIVTLAAVVAVYQGRDHDKVFEQIASEWVRVDDPTVAA